MITPIMHVHNALEKCSDEVFRIPMVSIYVFILVSSGIQICLWKIQIWVLLFQLAIFLELLLSRFEYNFNIKFYLNRPSSRDITLWKSRTLIWIFRRQIWIPEITRIKSYMDNMGMRNTSSEHLSSALCTVCGTKFLVLPEVPTFYE